MRRILKCTKDTYITNKYINGTRVTDANVGQGGTLDLYKLFDETNIVGSTTGSVELTRLLLKFDIDQVKSITGSVDINDRSKFKCLLSLSDIYGGQPTPSNFTVSLFPLALPFTEGRGQDVVGYRDADVANWLSASAGVGWNVTGAYASGTLSVDSNIDYYVSTSNAIAGGFGLGVSQDFERGDENLVLDVTTLVSGTIAGYLPDNGFRLSFSTAEENDANTYFVKRFASRHVRDPFLHPTVEVLADDSVQDLELAAYFNRTTPLFVYNKVFGTYENFLSGSAEIVGYNTLLLTLIASRSITVSTTSWSETHSASITYNTSSVAYYSTSFTGSQYRTGDQWNTGMYHADVLLNTTTDTTLATFLSQGDNNSVTFQPVWQSFDKTVTFSAGNGIVFKRIQGTGRNVAERNFVLNITNLKHYYTREEKARFRLFIQDYNTELQYSKMPLDLVSEVFNNVHWRLVQAYTRDTLVPFDTVCNSTRLSSDGGGMYFDCYMSDLEPNQVYELEFMIVENGEQYLVINQGFRFKLIP